MKLNDKIKRQMLYKFLNKAIKKEKENDKNRKEKNI
jgi:hypothetical protein